MAKLNIVQAINLALHEEMERDPNVIVMGEDVGVGEAVGDVVGLGVGVGVGVGFAPRLIAAARSWSSGDVPGS